MIWSDHLSRIEGSLQVEHMHIHIYREAEEEGENKDQKSNYWWILDNYSESEK